MNIYVGNLPYSVDEEELRGVFEKYGDVESVEVTRYRRSGKSKGFGFVDMPSYGKAQAAIHGLDGTEFEGRKLAVAEAHPPRSMG